nr:hypothetical protein [Tanacetum cinerariifolium]
MSTTKLPPIPPPLGANMLLVSSGGSHVTNFPGFEAEDFTSWKIRFMAFLDGLEPYLLKNLEEGPFTPMSPLSSPENPLPKRQNQWTHAETRLNNLILAYEGPSDTRDTKIVALRLKFNAFNSLEGKVVKGTFTRMKCLLNDLESNGVTIPQAEVNATFYNYEEGLIDKIYESETQRFTIGTSSSKALIFNSHSLDNDSDVEEDNKSNNEFMDDLNAEYQERALLANQKRFYKRSWRVGADRKPMDKSKEICFAYGKACHFQKDCPSNKTSTPSYPYPSKPYHKPISYTPAFIYTPSPNPSKPVKDYEEDECATRIKAFMAIAKDEPSVGKADARSGQWVEITMKKVHILILIPDDDDKKHVLDHTHVDLHYVEDQRKNLVNKSNSLKNEVSVYKSELGNLKNTMSINQCLQNEIVRVNLENESLKEEFSELKKVIENWTCSKVTLDQLISEQVPSNIVQALGGKGRRTGRTPCSEVVFTKADESSFGPNLENPSDFESEGEPQEPLPALFKLIGADPTGTSTSLVSLTDLTTNLTDPSFVSNSVKKISKKQDKTSNHQVIKKKAIPKPTIEPKTCPNKKADSSTEQFLLILMEEVKGLKDQIKTPLGTPLSDSQARSSSSNLTRNRFKPCIHCGLRSHHHSKFFSKPKSSSNGPKDHHKPEIFQKALAKLNV